MERMNHDILIRLTKSQHQRLKFLADVNNYKTISQYVRSRLLESPTITNDVRELLNKIKTLKKGQCIIFDEAK